MRKRGIARLEFQLGQINNMKDIRQKVLRIDYDEYIKSLTGPGKITDRMIYSVAKKQNVSLLKSDNVIEHGLSSIIEANEEIKLNETTSTTVTQPVESISTPWLPVNLFLIKIKRHKLLLLGLENNQKIWV